MSECPPPAILMASPVTKSSLVGWIANKMIPVIVTTSDLDGTVRDAETLATERHDIIDPLGAVKIELREMKEKIASAKRLLDGA